MSQSANGVPVTTYQFEIDDEKWQDWKDTVPRSKALDERIRELIEADTEGRVSEHVDEPEDNEPTREREPERESEPEPVVDDTSADAADPVTTVVDRVSDNWDDTEDRMEARRAAARAVLQHAVDTGDAVGKGEAIDQFLPEHAVDGQGDETWWRKNIRPVLKAVGEYSNGRHGYLVDEGDLEEFLDEDE